MINRNAGKNDRPKTAGFLRSRDSIFGNLRGVLDLCGGAAASPPQLSKRALKLRRFQLRGRTR